MKGFVIRFVTPLFQVDYEDVLGDPAACTVYRNQQNPTSTPDSASYFIPPGNKSSSHSQPPINLHLNLKIQFTNYYYYK
jgi:hypothetical protein